MKELPQNKFFEGFYIWFNKDKKEEYYATPLYMHNTNFNMDNDNRTLKIYMKKEKFDGLKYPAVINFPYVESFGMMLLQFLNADEPKCVALFGICINVSDEHDSKIESSMHSASTTK